MLRQLVDHALEWGWDNEFGGFYDKGEAFGGEAFDKTKVWWTQAEGLNALLVMHRRFGDKTDRYWKAFVKQWEFIERFMIDPVHGGWYMETTREGKLRGDGRKASQWKANYHTSRALMNVATMLGAIERGDERHAVTLEIEAGAFDRRDTPVIFPLPEGLDRATAFQMEQLDNHQPISVQLLRGEHPSLVWIVRNLPARTSVRYRLEPKGPSFGGPVAMCDDRESTLVLQVGSQAPLRYSSGVNESPKGLDPVFRRSGYIHPLLTPSGLCVTDDFAPDHAHQHGLFFAWVNTTFEGRQVDFLEPDRAAPGRRDTRRHSRQRALPCSANSRSSSSTKTSRDRHRQSLMSGRCASMPLSTTMSSILSRGKPAPGQSRWRSTNITTAGLRSAETARGSIRPCQGITRLIRRAVGRAIS